MKNDKMLVLTILLLLLEMEQPGMVQGFIKIMEKVKRRNKSKGLIIFERLFQKPR